MKTAMRQTGCKNGVMGGIVLKTYLFLILFAFAPSVSEAQHSTLTGTLTHLPDLSGLPGQATFLLRIRNVGRHRTGVCLYRWLYELRLFDARGHKLTDEKSFLAAAKLKPPGQADYAIIAPQQSISLKLVPVVAGKGGTVPATTRKADCILRPVYTEWAQKKMPATLRKTGIKLSYIGTVKAIALKQRIKR